MTDRVAPATSFNGSAGAAFDLTRYRIGNAGIPYCMTFAASRSGPHLLLVALLHGNETCGAAALDQLLAAEVRPRRGRLSFAFANVAAYERFDAGAQAPTRFLDEDMNRVWSDALLEGGGTSAEIRRARGLRPLVDSADFLLDIHSMQQGPEPLVLCGALKKGRDFAESFRFPATIVADRGHAAGPRLRDYGGFGDPASTKNALLVECGPHDAPHSVEVALAAAVRFLRHFDLIAEDPFPLPHITAMAGPRMIEVTEAVTAVTDRFTFTAAWLGLERVPKAGTVIARDGDRPIVTPYDDCVLVMPACRCQPGQTAVRLGRIIA